MNIIRLTEQQYDDIFKWRDNNIELVCGFKNHIFNKGMIEIKMNNGNICKIKFENKDDSTFFNYSNTLNNIKISVDGKFIKGKYHENINEETKKSELTNFIEIAFPFLQDILKNNNEEDDFKIKKIVEEGSVAYEDIILNVISLYVALNVYVQNNERLIHTKVENVGGNKTNNKKHSKKKHNKKKLLKVTYIKNIDINQKIEHSTHKFTIESWEVKGHYRTYKNGKKVWVKPYVKGNKNNINKEENIYVL